MRVTDSVRLQVLHTLDFRKTLANPGSPDDRKRGRELSRIIARDAPVARDLGSNLLDTVERLSVGHDATPGAVASGVELPPAPGPLPARGAPERAATAVAAGAAMPDWR